MGKLHSLRKEIEREPDRWYEIASKHNTIFGRIPCGAYVKNGKWVPITSTTRGQHPHAYRMYVRKVLYDLNIRTDKPRAVTGVGRHYAWRRKGK